MRQSLGVNKTENLKWFTRISIILLYAIKITFDNVYHRSSLKMLPTFLLANKSNVKKTAII